METNTRGQRKSLPAGCLALFGVPFAFGGLSVWFQAFRELQAGKHKDALMLGLFGLVFCGAGFAMIAAGIFGKRWQRKISEREAQHPDSPWLWREDWASGEVRNNQRGAAVMLWIFAAFWNGISWTIALGFLKDSGVRDKAIYLVALFPLIGLFLIWGAVSSTLKWRRFGCARFRLNGVPVAPGGVLSGTVEIPGELPHDAPVFLRLNCARREQEGSGKNRRTRDAQLWQDERTLRPGLPQTGPGEVSVPVFFRLPENQPPSSSSGGDGSVHWTLEVHAKIPGPNLQLEFEVPVFPGGTPAPVPDHDPTAPYHMPVDELRQMMRSRIRTTQTPEGLEIYFPAARHPGSAVFMGLFLVGWTGAIYFAFRQGAPIIFPIVLGLFDLLILYGFLEFALRSSRLRAAHDALWSRQNWLILSRTRQFPASEIADFTATVGSKSGRQSFYDLKVKTRDGKDRKLASLIPSKPEAEWLVSELRGVYAAGQEGPRNDRGINQSDPV